jgi:hypothetical protein
LTAVDWMEKVTDQEYFLYEHEQDIPAAGKQK